ncbi:TPA: AfaD family invasin, partial [Klebsiella aerogenes]
ANAYASAARLVLQMDHGLQAGFLRDGTQLGRGAIVSDEGTGMFQLRSHSLQSDADRGTSHYILTGQQNAAHQLKVTLIPVGDTRVQHSEVYGLVLSGNQNQAHFSVVADGDQQVAADRYTLRLGGRTLLLR